MKRTLCIPVLALAGLAASLLTPQSAPAEDLSPRLVKIGLVKTMFRGTPDSVVEMVMKPFKTLLEAQTGAAGQLVTTGDPMDLARKLQDDQVQLGIFHGFEFAWARQKYPELEPLIIAVNRHPELKAVLVVRQDSKVRGPEDLQGATLSLPGITREHCRLYVERRCVKEGVAEAKCFKKVRKPATTQDALDEVFEKRADATVVDGVALEEYRKAKPGRCSKLKVIHDSGPLPCAVVAYRAGRFDPETLRRFQAGLLSARSCASGKRMLEMIRITGFEHVPDSYPRQLADSVANYPPPAGK